MVAGVAVAWMTLSWGAEPISGQSNQANRVRESATVFDEIMSAPDSAIPDSVLSKAAGIAIFPGTLRAGFVVGGHRGRGILSARDSESGTWSAPAFLTLTGGSFGLQIGGEAIDLLLIIMNERGLRNLVSNQWKVGANASVAAGPVGRSAEASTDIQLRAEILSYSRSRGLFAGISLEGTTIRQDRDGNEDFYGERYETGDIVFERLGGAPEPVAQWRDTLTKYID